MLGRYLVVADQLAGARDADHAHSTRNVLDGELKALDTQVGGWVFGGAGRGGGRSQVRVVEVESGRGGSSQGWASSRVWKRVLACVGCCSVRGDGHAGPSRQHKLCIHITPHPIPPPRTRCLTTIP